MQNELVKTENVKRMYSALERFHKGVRGRHGLGLIYGPEGTGKTFSGQKVCVDDERYVYKRAAFLDRPKTLMEAIVIELGGHPRGTAKNMFNQAKLELVQNPRTLWLDEMDYPVDQGYIEMIRDLSDEANVPIIITGMASIERKLQKYPHLYDRILMKLRFEFFDFDQIKKLSSDLCGVEIDDSGLQFILEKGQGKYRLTNQFFEIAEALAKNNKLKIVSAAHLKQFWKKR